MNQGKNAHRCALQAVGRNIGSALNDQFSRTVNSTKTAHLRKVGKLFNGSQNHLQLLFSRGWILCQDKVIRDRKLFGSLTGPQDSHSLLGFWLPRPTGCNAPERLMLDHSPGIILADTFFDQLAVVLVKRKVLSHCLIDNKASVPLLRLRD
jgi:hypothetical protein